MKKPTRAAPVNYKQIADDLGKSNDRLQDKVDEYSEEIMRVRALLQEVRGTAADWKKAHDAEVEQRRHADNHVSAAEADATRHARKADFWKGVAMGLDQTKASEIEARQRQRSENGGSPLSDYLYKQGR